MKFSRYILFSAAMLALGACSEDTMDKINKNEGNPPEIGRASCRERV